MTNTYMTQYSKFSRVSLTNLLYKGRKCYSEVHWDAMLKESSPEFLLQTYYNVILFIILFSAENIPLSGRKGKKKNTLILRKLNNAEQRMSYIEKLNDKWKTDDW